MQPTTFNTMENFNNLMAMRVFVEACEQWCYENKNYKYSIHLETTYFDHGQDWKWTTFITTDEDTENVSDSEVYPHRSRFRGFHDFCDIIGWQGHTGLFP